MPIHWIVNYPVDNAIHFLNNRGQIFLGNKMLTMLAKNLIPFFHFPISKLQKKSLSKYCLTKIAKSSTIKVETIGSAQHTPGGVALPYKDGGVLVKSFKKAP